MATPLTIRRRPDCLSPDLVCLDVRSSIFQHVFSITSAEAGKEVGKMGRLSWEALFENSFGDLLKTVLESFLGKNSRKSMLCNSRSKLSGKTEVSWGALFGKVPWGTQFSWQTQAIFGKYLGRLSQAYILETILGNSLRKFS